MFVDLLSDNKKRDIFTKLLKHVEEDKIAVEKSVKFREIHTTKNGYFMYYSNGFESKVVEIDDLIATISSESTTDNLEITRIYQNEMLKVFSVDYANFLDEQKLKVEDMELFCY